MTTELLRPVLLIDLSAIFRAAFHANENGPTGVTFQATMDGVRRAVGMVPDCLVGVCCDGKGNWRKALSPEYKAHREKQPESMYGQLDKVKAQLVADGFLLWTADGYEADDLIASATAKARAAGHDVVIASHDKDVTQLIDAHTKMLKTSTWDFVDEAAVVAKFGVEPAGVGDLLALWGDKSDGIEGIPSVGQVTAAKLLIQHGDLDGIFRAVNALPVIEGSDGAPQIVTKTPEAAKVATPAIVDKLWRFEKQARLARELVTLKTDAPIEFQDIYKERKIVTKTNDVNFDDEVISGPTVPAGVEAAGATPSDAAAETSSTGPVTTTDATATVETQTASRSEALTVIDPEYTRQLEPKSGQQALVAARLLYESRLYSRFPTPESIFAVIARGRELNLGMTSALASFHIIEGAPVASAQLLISLAKKHHDCEFFQLLDSSATSATWVTKNRRNPTPTKYTYDIEEARAAGLVKGPWLTRPRDMLLKTAGSKLARIEYPDALLGLYSADEMGGES